MPYDTIYELPKTVRKELPEHAQEIYKEAFNHAWEEYREPSARRGSESREAVAYKVAWAAVKKAYHKDILSGLWVEGGER